MTALDLAGRSIARASLIERATGAGLDPATIACVGVAAAACGAAVSWTRIGPRVDALVVWILLAALPAGLAAQLALGARLQSDGFYYFAHLRSLWFDHDQDLANDYRLLAMESKTNLFVPTITGHAQSAWTIGPSLVWAPFFAVGDAVARYEQRSDPRTQDGWHVVPLSPGRLRRGTGVGTVGPLLHLPAERAVRREGLGGGSDDRGRRRIVSALVSGQGAVDDARAVDGRCRRLHLGLGGDPRTANAVAVGGAWSRWRD